MNIVFYDQDTARAQDWAQQLQAQGLKFTALFWHESAAQQLQADYAVVWMPPDAFYTDVHGLQAIFSMGAGVDAILQSAALPQDIPLIRLDTPEMAKQMANYVLHAVIEISHHMQTYREQQSTKTWQAGEYPDHQQWPIGVMGLGRIGATIAQALQARAYPVHGWARTPKQLDQITCHHGQAGLSSFLQNSRILVNVLPLTPETEGILNHATLGQLPKGSYLINIARGAHLQEQDLLDLLNQQHLAGAVLDVFRTEPLPENHPFWNDTRIRITPHISGPTSSAQALAQIALGIERHQAGHALINRVDRKLGY